MRTSRFLHCHVGMEVWCYTVNTQNLPERNSCGSLEQLGTISRFISSTVTSHNYNSLSESGNITVSVACLVQVYAHAVPNNRFRLPLDISLHL